MTILVGAPIAVLLPISAQTPAQTRSTPRSDLALLFKAAEKALNVPAFQTDSLTEINGTANGVSAKMQFQTSTIVQSPKRFRSEVRVGNDPVPRFVIVSDGRTVSVYRSDRKEYSTMSHAAFDRRDDNFIIGMSSQLYLTISPGLKDFNAQGGFNNEAFQKQLSTMIPAELKSRTEKTNEGDLVVYDYPDRQKGFTYAMAVNPIDASIKQLRLAGKEKGFDLVMTETIQRRTVNPTISANAFRLTPPKGAKRVKPISLSPF
jgi:outer membrane lipoprotein-sorting protein